MSSADLSGRFTSPRVKWTDDELRIVLGYYFFIYENNTREQDYESFADDLRKMTGNSRSNGSVGVIFCNFISVDPAKTSAGFPGGNKKCLPIWNECINPDRTPKESFIKLFMAFIEKYGNKKSIYDTFVNKYSGYRSLNNVDVDDEDGVITTNDIFESEVVEPSYAPEEKPEIIEGKNKKYKRNSTKAKRAIIYANYQCNIDGCHGSFVAKNGNLYMEAHHLIPMSAQDDFNNSLDVDANIVSLCPTCHRKLHHGKDIEVELKKLFDSRVELLKQSGIEITLDDLKKYY